MLLAQQYSANTYVPRSLIIPRHFDNSRIKLNMAFWTYSAVGLPDRIRGQVGLGYLDQFNQKTVAN